MKNGLTILDRAQHQMEDNRGSAYRTRCFPERYFNFGSSGWQAHLAEVGFYREVRVKGFDSMLKRTLITARRQLLKMRVQTFFYRDSLVWLEPDLKLR
jgi:hypothetical protein